MTMKLYLSLTVVICLGGCQAQLHFSDSDTAINFDFELTVTPDVIEKYVTQNVTLECSQSGPDATTVQRVTDIRILKRQSGNVWSTLAELGENDQDVKTVENVTATGHLRDVTLLAVTWPLANDQTFGRYKCDVTGFDQNQNSVVQESAVLVVVEHNITAREVLDIVWKEQENFKQDFYARMQGQNEKLIDFMQTLNQTQITEADFAIQLADLAQNQIYFQNRTEEILRNLETEWQKRIDAPIQSLEVRFSTLELAYASKNYSLEPLTTSTVITVTTESTNDASPCQQGSVSFSDGTVSWPEGVYGLLMPDSGCPNDTYCTQWNTGYFKIYTEMDDNHNEVSSPAHMATPIEETKDNKTFMFQRFCVVSEPSLGTQWPNGSYCINRRGDDCPRGFGLGYIHYDEENTDYNGAETERGVTPYRGYDMYIMYCCRSDGLPSNPMVLPTSSPFYLYRYQGQCQDVAGMNVQEEYMLFDTENDDNHDSFSYRHPDATLNDTRIELCYYYK